MHTDVTCLCSAGRENGFDSCLHLGAAAPDGQLKHELLNGGEEGIHGGQARRDDNVACCVSSHKGVAVAVAAHP